MPPAVTEEGLTLVRDLLVLVRAWSVGRPVDLDAAAAARSRLLALHHGTCCWACTRRGRPRPRPRS